MKKEIFEKIKIPEGVEAEVKGNLILIKGKEGEIEREFNLKNVDLKKEKNEIIIGHKKSTKKEKKIIKSIAAHIKNMIKGVQEKFEYKLKICYSHFPFTVEIKNNKAVIKNFLGEKHPRETTIPSNAEVESDKEFITVKSTDIEKAGQVAANFERLTTVKGRDRRIFQDGIFMTHKAGREI